MFAIVMFLAACTFFGLVLRRLKYDIDQENQFRAKLKHSVQRNLLQQS